MYKVKSYGHGIERVKDKCMGEGPENGHKTPTFWWFKGGQNLTFSREKNLYTAHREVKI